MNKHKIPAGSERELSKQF